MAFKAIELNEIQTHIVDKTLDIKFFPIIDSTNGEARRHVLSGKGAPCAFVAAQQMEGKGRVGRSFYSPADTGLYFSLLFADGGERDTVLITSAAAVAVRRAISRTTGIETAIKWVNDLYYNDKKVCGILAESVFLGEDRYIILGVGINACTEIFPEEIAHKAGSLGLKTEDGNLILAACINELIDMWNNLDAENFIDEYREHSMVLGKKVVYTVNGIEREGIAKGIDERGRLCVKHEDGSVNVLASGEISLRLND